MNFATDCLAHTGAGGVPLLIAIGVALLGLGTVAVIARKSWLAKSALLLVPLMLIAGLALALAAPTPAHADTTDGCSASDTSTPTPTPTAVAPLITNSSLEIYAGYPGADPVPFALQITASGDTPITFAFVDPAAATSADLTIEPSTGAVSETGGLLSACVAVVTIGNTSGVTLGISATNAAGSDTKMFHFFCDS